MKISLRKIQFWVIGFFFAVALIVWVMVFSATPSKYLRVSFLDVGQGDSVLIEAPNGNKVLVDGGPPTGAVLSELGVVLPYFDRHIDMVVATHPDVDHIGGIPDVLERYSVQALFEPDVYSDNGAYPAMEVDAEKYGVQKIIARRGTTITLDKNTSLQILYPDHKVPVALGTNASSVVVLLHYGDTSFLLTGDLPSEQEDELVATYGMSLHADVLKFGHHGSKTSTSPLFLANVNPSLGVVSAGAENRYGHPHKEVLDLAERAKVKVLRTDTMGRITFESDGEKISYTTEK